MKLNPSYKIRRAIYIANMVGSPIMAYLLARNVIGTLEVQLWAAEMLVVFALAGLNVTEN